MNLASLNSRKMPKLARKPKWKSDKDVKSIYYTIYGNCCSDPKVVQKHLHSGALIDMIVKKESKMLSALTGSKKEQLENCMSDPCYAYVLLGACAMTLGCKLPDAYIAMLKKVYTEGGLMPDAQQQMKTALFGPNGYKNGRSYDFESKMLMETANSPEKEDRKPNSFGFIGMNVPSPGGFFNAGMTTSTTSAVLKELREQLNKPDLCGGCGSEHGTGGKALRMCSKCKNRKYCSVECQKNAWKVHKKVCDPAKISSMK